VSPPRGLRGVSVLIPVVGICRQCDVREKIEKGKNRNERNERRN
jgi:hypothetical protein